MKKHMIEFKTENEDTCMENWIFHMNEDVIEKIDVSGKRGCKGHPKTIMALAQNIALDSFDLAALAQSTCVREKSCGMMLGECIEKIMSRNR